MDGVIVLDKPYGWSSNYAVQKVKGLVNTKVGHSGSLDPAATGMLLLFLGKTTKFVQYLLNADKSYVVTGKLGFTTDSGDRETEEIAFGNWENISPSKIQQTIKIFTGKQLQTPPMYSALKQNGIPLYQLARKGKIIERIAREIIIYQIELLKFNPPFFQLFVRCSKGTYIRTLVEDIGKALNCGAYVYDLRRTSIATLNETEMLTFEELENSNINHKILPLDKVLQDKEPIFLTNQERLALLENKVIFHQATDGCKRLYYLNKFIGLGELQSNKLKFLKYFHQ